MRSTVVLGGLLAIASCDNTAIQIVVHGDLAVDEVRLFIGVDGPLNTEDQAELLVPSGYTYPAMPRGFYWKRDANNEADRAALVDGEASFVFVPGAHDRFGAVIAIGYQAGAPVAAASLFDATMVGGSVRRYDVTLAAADDPFAPMRVPTRSTIQVWGPEPGNEACARFVDTRPEAPPNRSSIYVVTKNDEDCDGLVSELSGDDPQERRDCRPNVFHGRVRAPRDKLACLVDDDIPSTSADPDTTACVLGGGGCVDGRGDGCNAGTVCAQSALCQACAGAAAPLDCAALDTAAGVDIATRISCKFDAVRAANELQLCETTAAVTTRLLPTATTQACRPDPLFRTVSDGAWRRHIVSGAAVFTVSTVSPMCTFDITAAGKTTNAEIATLATFELANGRGIAIPIGIAVQEVPECTTSVPICTIVELGTNTDDRFRRCLVTPIVEPW